MRKNNNIDNYYHLALLSIYFYCFSDTFSIRFKLLDH